MLLLPRRLLAVASVVVFARLTWAGPAPENWAYHCQKCHGTDGRGQTKTGKKLQVRDYTDAKVQAALTDEQIIHAITQGVTDKEGRERMPSYQLELSEQEIADLGSHIRAFKP